MRKITLLLHTSLDGFAAGPAGEMDWIRIDEDLFDIVKTLTDQADTALYGRVTWQMMEKYWPTAASKRGATKHDREHSEWYNRTEKVVVSNTMVLAGIPKTTIMNGDIPQKIHELKKSTGKDILLIGSPSVVRALTEHNLIDNYRLFINPVILGKGIPVYTTIKERIQLTLGSAKQLPCGVIALFYSNGN